VTSCSQIRRVEIPVIICTYPLAESRSPSCDLGVVVLLLDLITISSVRVSPVRTGPIGLYSVRL